MSHDHCGHEHHDHDHDHEPSGPPPNNLYARIDRQNVTVLNAQEGTDPCTPLKAWHERQDETKYIESDADDQLIFRIPFTGSVKLRALLLKAGPGEQTPEKVLLFPNADGLDFDDANDQEPAQSFDVVQARDVGEYTVKCRHTEGEQNLSYTDVQLMSRKVYYIGLLGEWSEFTRDPVITMYEAQANPADHKKIVGTEGALSRPGL